MHAIKTYKQGPQILVAACDEDLLDQRFEEGNLRLHVDPGFYDGNRVDAMALLQHLAGCSVANLVGDETVQVAVDNGLVDPGNVMTIGGVRHAQVLVL